MRSSEAVRRSHAPGAYAIVKGDPPRILLAENGEVISRLVALQIVAAEDPAAFSPEALGAVRLALLEERWADAVVIWMETTGTFIDVYEEYVPVWTDDELDGQHASMEIRVSRIFEDR
jgi:hypothetical protein